MNLKLLEKMPENFRFFKGKEIRTLVDLETDELWFVAKDIANILGVSKQAMTDAFKGLEKNELSTVKLYPTNSKDID